MIIASEKEFKWNFNNEASIKEEYPQVAVFGEALQRRLLLCSMSAPKIILATIVIYITTTFFFPNHL
ncbi:hypothetical protein VNO78_20175 [Psophocarpus tetragonolobus]|uniref:Uncharacterized protein n=1 Tax=Psophocarpus tetragonolobus TaxID=3891 RepID=A0AAN9SAF8_PSOTE